MPKKLDKYEFIWRSIQKHGYKYDYSKVDYINVETKVCIICHEKDEFGKEHGEFWMRPNDHMNNHGCSKCKNVKKLTTKDFIEKSKAIHGDKYDYSKVDYKGNKIKVCIICPIHGEFWQRPNEHLSGNGCIKCSMRYTYTTEEFIEKTKAVHGNEYDYSKVNYINAFTKVCIICNKKDKNGNEHGEFWMRPSNHLNTKSKCPICNSNNKSRMEESIFNELLTITNNIERQKTFDWLKYKRHLFIDFYLPEHNIAIEVNGDQHYIPIKKFGGNELFEKQKTRDKLKYDLCKKHNIKLFYITKKNNNIDEIKKYIYETSSS